MYACSLIFSHYLIFVDPRTRRWSTGKDLLQTFSVADAHRGSEFVMSSYYTHCNSTGNVLFQTFSVADDHRGSEFVMSSDYTHRNSIPVRMRAH